jgi:hypothetical protein
LWNYTLGFLVIVNRIYSQRKGKKIPFFWWQNSSLQDMILEIGEECI